MRLSSLTLTSYASYLSPLSPLTLMPLTLTCLMSSFVPFFPFVGSPRRSPRRSRLTVHHSRFVPHSTNRQAFYSFQRSFVICRLRFVVRDLHRSSFSLRGSPAFHEKQIFFFSLFFLFFRFCFSFPFIRFLFCLFFRVLIICRLCFRFFILFLVIYFFQISFLFSCNRFYRL